MSLAVFGHNQSLARAITAVLIDFQTNASQFPFDAILLKPVEKFIVGGKLFRGGLCLSVTAALLKIDQPTSATLAAAAALELAGSAILIQDDVMDEAVLRRDLPALHHQYAQLADLSFSKAFRFKFGESAAVCVSDVLLFLATQILSQADCAAEMRLKLIQTLSKELTTLALNQAEELRFAALPLSHPDVTSAHILQIMIGKTARYTAQWPLKFAGILAGVDKTTQTALQAYGEAMGVVFQLSDDRLGLFGDPVITGKDVDSDAKTGKKTFYALYAQEMLIGAEAKKFQRLYGKADLTLAELGELQELIEKTGIAAKVADLTSDYVLKAKQAIQSLTAWPELQILLTETVEFLATRQR